MRVPSFRVPTARTTRCIIIMRIDIIRVHNNYNSDALRLAFVPRDFFNAINFFTNLYGWCIAYSILCITREYGPMTIVPTRMTTVQQCPNDHDDKPNTIIIK